MSTPWEQRRLALQFAYGSCRKIKQLLRTAETAAILSFLILLNMGRLFHHTERMITSSDPLEPTQTQQSPQNFTFKQKSLGLTITILAVSIIGSYFLLRNEPLVIKYNKWATTLSDGYWQVIEIKRIPCPMARVDLIRENILNFCDSTGILEDPITFRPIPENRITTPSTIMIGKGVYELTSLLQTILDSKRERNNGEIPHPYENRVMTSEEPANL